MISVNEKDRWKLSNVSINPITLVYGGRVGEESQLMQKLVANGWYSLKPQAVSSPAVFSFFLDYRTLSTSLSVAYIGFAEHKSMCSQ